MYFTKYITPNIAESRILKRMPVFYALKELFNPLFENIIMTAQ